MLKKFEVKNYKNFQDALTIDFDNIGGYQFNTECLYNNAISKMIVYGRNATGKTNLGYAVCDIAYSPIALLRRSSTNFLNADGDETFAKFLYVFQFGDDELEYSYEKYSMPQYKSEKLILNNTVIFDFDYSNKTYYCENLDDISAETVIVERFIEAKKENIEETDAEPIISFLRWLFANAVFSNESPITKLRNYISRMRILNISAMMSSNIRFGIDAFFETLEGEKLKNLEDFLNGMGVECELETQKLPDGQYELYFKKKKKLIPFFENASSGTLVLFNIYRRLIPLMENMSFCYLDEFDAFYHYEMSERFLTFFKEKFPNCQMIFTTHNTNLMSNSLMRPDCLFILSRKGKLTPLNKATPRELREGQKLEKMYISGEFEEHE